MLYINSFSSFRAIAGKRLTGVVACLAVLGMTSGVFGQSAPTTIGLSNDTTWTSGSINLMPAPTITSTLNAPGVNPGQTVIQYGQANSPFGSFELSGTSNSPTSLKFFTAASATPTTLGAADGFVNTAPALWTVLQPKTGSTSAFYLYSDDTNSTWFNLTNTGGTVAPTSAAINARLNQVLRFDSSSFIDPATNNPIVVSGGSAVGSFSFNATLVGSQITAIDLVYSPVPEPATILGLSAVGAMAIGGVRRLRRKTGAVIA